MNELSVPLPAWIETFDTLDRIGILRLETGQALRFGESACVGFTPTVGGRVYVTVTAEHGPGGTKAVKVHRSPVSESRRRQIKSARKRWERREQIRRDRARHLRVRLGTTPASIVRRVQEAARVRANHVADPEALYELIDEIELVGGGRIHARAILRGIALSPEDANFGNPGPLVHFLEGFADYPEMLCEIARNVPTLSFARMLSRCADKSPSGREALRLLRAYRLSAPASLREEAEWLLENMGQA